MKRQVAAVLRAAGVAGHYAISAVGALDLRDVIGWAGFGLVVHGVSQQFGAPAGCIVAGCAMVTWTIFAVRRK